MSRNMPKILLSFSVLAILTVGVAAWYGFSHWGQIHRSTVESQGVFLEVNRGESSASVIRRLFDAGLIDNQTLFMLYGRFTGKLSRIKAGDYRFTPDMTPDQVYGVLTSGQSYGVPVTIPEGYSMAQIADVLEKVRPGAKKEFMSLVRDRGWIASLGPWPGFEQGQIPDSLEGYLYPETYKVTRKEPLSHLVKQMVLRFRSHLNEDLLARAQALGLNPHQFVILASVVEKETGASDERPLVASVFHNRLRKGMRLQSDPTVIYGIENYDGRISKADLLRPTPYNTYTKNGLPAGPICNPGVEALKATANPATSDYLYFVSYNNGTHKFSVNYADHQAAVQRYQVDPKAREGHSWRELHQGKQAEK